KGNVVADAPSPDPFAKPVSQRLLSEPYSSLVQMADEIAEISPLCCLMVAKRRLPARLVESYMVQETEFCSISATGHTEKWQMLCLPHPEEEPWVRTLLEKVDQRLSTATPA
ncbi:hypothetical protein WMY93_034152, partial [Mugilogobius chulae]